MEPPWPRGSCHPQSVQAVATVENAGFLLLRPASMAGVMRRDTPVATSIYIDSRRSDPPLPSQVIRCGREFRSTCSERGREWNRGFHAR